MSSFKLKRSDSIYIEIENFKDFEFTNNISYEMAVRNDEVKKIKQQYDEASKRCSTENIEEFFHRMQTGTLIDEEYARLGSILRKNYYITVFADEENNDFSKKLLYPSFNAFISTPDENNNYDSWILSENISVAVNLTPTFSRPYVLPPEAEDKRLPFFLNLNLPIEELMAYISEIKRRFESNHIHITTIAEILGEEYTKSNSTVRHGARSHDSLSVLAYKYKVADMFFTYDANKMGASANEVRQAIFEYYAKHNRGVSYSDNTRYKYLDIAKEYIENLKYKELITGVHKDTK